MDFTEAAFVPAERAGAADVKRQTMEGERKEAARVKLPALIPVRRGSRGIRDKNVQPVGGVPLLVRSIRTALAARRVSRVVVSTECPEMAALARDAGAEVPFLRPPDLAGDDTLVSEVVRHAWDVLENPHGVILLQVTSPFVQPETVDRAVETFLNGGAPVFKAVKRAEDHPKWLLKLDGEQLVPYLAAVPGRRQQDQPPLYVPCGAVYVYSPQTVLDPARYTRASWFELGWPETLDIDDLADLDMARLIAPSPFDIGTLAEEVERMPEMVGE